MVQTTPQIPLLDLKAQYALIKDEITQSISNVLESGNYIMGPFVTQFEQAFADYIGVKHAIGVANGTDALLLSLDAYGIGPGDEVITSSFTFFASGEVVSQMGAKPVFVDINPETYNLDVDQVKRAITAKTKAIIPVHIFGQPADMDVILQLAKEHSLYVIEDACQAIGSKFNGKKVGSMGDTGCFSFFPTKNLGCYGDGGIITTNDDEIAQKLRILRAHGSNPKYYHEMVGYNSRLDAIQAAVLSVKLKYIDEWNKARQEKAAKYNDLLKDTPLVLPYKEDGREHVYHLYIVQSESREELMAYLGEKGISTGVYYPVPLHRQSVYKDLGYAENSLPISEKMANRTFALPLYPELTDEQQRYIAEQVSAYYQERGEV